MGCRETTGSATCCRSHLKRKSLEAADLGSRLKRLAWRRSFIDPGVGREQASAAEWGTMTTGAMGDDEGLLTEQDAAELLQVPLSTLRRWQREGKGPPCLKIGRQVRYRQVAVQRWLTGGLQASSPDENR